MRTDPGPTERLHRTRAQPLPQGTHPAGGTCTQQRSALRRRGLGLLEASHRDPNTMALGAVQGALSHEVPPPPPPPPTNTHAHTSRTHTHRAESETRSATTTTGAWLGTRRPGCTWRGGPSASPASNTEWAALRRRRRAVTRMGIAHRAANSRPPTTCATHPPPCKGSKLSLAQLRGLLPLPHQPSKL
jgi:hypothetical protein